MGHHPKNLFNMTDDSDLFRTREDLEGDGWRLDGNVFVKEGKRMLPLYEAKMVDYLQPPRRRCGEERDGGQPAEPAERT